MRPLWYRREEETQPMLDAYIIERLKREREERQRDELRRIEAPQRPTPRRDRAERREEDTDRGVVIIDYSL